jgi:hypothetical protein
MNEPSSSPLSHGFSVNHALTLALQRWWIMALLVLMGGLCGLVFDLFLPPDYEAGFYVLVGIDQTNAGELTQYEQDVLFESIGGILYAPSMLQQVAATASAQGMEVTADWLKPRIRVERRQSLWQARVRAPSRGEAETLAHIWLNASQTEIQRAYASAETADGLTRYLQSLETCLAQAVTSPPSYGLCSRANLAAIQTELRQTGAEANAARLAARGVNTSLMIDLPQMDLIPAQRTLLQRGQRALAGSFIGFLIAIWLVQAPVPSWARRSNHG